MKTKALAIVLLLAAFSANVTAQFNYSSSKVVDLGLSVKWAGYNLGASSPEEPGGHYAWGDVTGTGNSPFTCKTLSGNMNISGDSRYDIARAKWGGSWRLPTAEEFKELLKKCTCMVVKSNSGIWGLWCKGPNGNAIFLPLAGEGDKDGGVLFLNSSGWYWSGNTITSRDFYGNTTCFAQELNAGRTITGAISFSMYKHDPSCRFSVRPVYDSSNSNTPKKTTTPTSPKTKPMGFNFLREQIKRWQELRNGALAERSGAGVVIYGRSGYAYTGSTPEALKNKIEEVNKANGKIEDVCVTENGDYCIIFDGNGYTAKGPTYFLNELAGFNRRKEKIRSVAIADGGTWAIVGETNTKCANTTMLQFIINARNKYGTIYSVSLSNMGAIVVCCERGVAWNNYVPNNVIEAIKKANFSVRYVKFSTNGKFIITDGNKTSRYNM